MITLYFVRHGQTDFNKRGIVQGSGVDSELNDLGRLQATAFFRHYRKVRFEGVYASLLQRTHQTLSPWAEQGYSFVKHPGLNELNWGIHEGIQPTPEQHRQFRATLQRWADGDLAAKVERGESPLEAWNRAEGLFRQLRRDYLNHNLLLCSHGRQLRVVLSSLIDGDLRHMEKYAHQNTGLTIVKIDREGKAHLELLNDTRHL